MGFKDKYTTADLISEDISIKTMQNLELGLVVDDKTISDEPNKMIISNDAYAIGEMLEELMNQISFRGRL